MDLFPAPKGKPEIVGPVKKISKLKYSKPRAIVEEEITQRSFIDAPPPLNVPPNPLIRK